MLVQPEDRRVRSRYHRPDMPRAMGLDLGDKRIGVAVSDELGLTAQPLTTLQRTNAKAVLTALTKLAADHEVMTIVIGLPLNMNGSEGPRARAAREFAERTQKATGIHCVLWDERLTTVAAERAMLEADLSRERRKQVVDRMAAQLILQAFLDGARLRGQAKDES